MNRRWNRWYMLFLSLLFAGAGQYAFAVGVLAFTITGELLARLHLRGVSAGMAVLVISLFLWVPAVAGITYAGGWMDSPGIIPLYATIGLFLRLLFETLYIFSSRCHGGVGQRYRWQRAATLQLRPLTILIAGPIGVGIISGIVFCVLSDPASTLAGAVAGAVSGLPLFGGLAWAAAPKRSSGSLYRVSEKYRRFCYWVSIAGVVAFSYILGYSMFHLDELLGACGEWLFIGAFLTVMFMALSKVIVYERLRRLRGLEP